MVFMVLDVVLVFGVVVVTVVGTALVAVVTVVGTVSDLTGECLVSLSTRDLLFRPVSWSPFFLAAAAVEDVLYPSWNSMDLD